MNWYIEITLANGTVDKLYCVSRAEARELRAELLRNSNPKYQRYGSSLITKAVVRKV